MNTRVRQSSGIFLDRYPNHFVAGLVFVLLFVAGPAFALDNVWTFNGDGNWDDGSKWSLTVPPEGSVTAQIDDGDTAVTVTLGSSHSIDALLLGANDTLSIESGASPVSLISYTSFTNAGTINVTGTDVQTVFLSLATPGDDTLTNTGALNFQVGGGQGTRIFTGDLVNSGTVNVDYDATWNKSIGTYTNTGQLSVPSGKTLTISNTGTLNQNTGGTFTLSGTLQNSSSTFNMNGGTMNFGASALVDNGNFNYLGGNIVGDVKLRNTTFTIGGGAAPETFQLDYSNTLASNVGAGHTINVESNTNTVSLISYTSFTNAGTINVTGTDVQTVFLSLATPGDDTLTNTGALNFQVGGGQGTRIFTGDLVNSGTVNVDYDATWNKSIGTYTNTGQLSVPSGKTLTISNTGTLNQNTGGTFTLSGTLQNSSSTFNMNGGTMNFGASALVDNGNFNYLGGNIVGDVKLRNTTFTIGGGAAPETFQLDYSNTLASNVGAGHTINVESNTNTVSLISYTSFTNAGTINVTGTDVQTVFLSLATPGDDTLTNTGALNFQVGGGQGTRIFTGDLVNSGTVNVDYDATWNKSIGTYTNTGQLSVPSGKTLTISNTGTLNQNTGGTFTLSGTLQNSSSTFNMNGGTMNFGASALVDNGNFNYLGGNIVGDVKLRNTTFTIGGGAAPETFQLDYSNTLASNVGAGHTINVESNTNTVSLISYTSFTNAGTINVTGTDVQTVFLSLATPGDDTLTNTGALNFQVGGGQGTRIFTGDLVNSGTVNINYSTTFNNSNGSYTNNGVLKIASGQVLDISNSGSFTNQGGTTFTGGTFDVAGILRYAGAYIQTNQAEIILRGGTIRDTSNNDALRDLSANGASGKLRLLESSNLSTSATNFTNNGIVELGGGLLNTSQPLSQLAFTNTTTGQLRGSGNIGGPVNNSGLVSPGASAGILGVLGFSQLSTGTLAMEIGGTNNADPQHPQFDVLNAISANLDGTLLLSLINGFTPTSTDTFTILNSGPLSGAFANVANGQRLFTTGEEGSFVVTYNSSPGSVLLSSFKLNIGDYNGNDRADAADFVTWRKSASPTPTAYALWRGHFNDTTSSGPSLGGLQIGAVPEAGAAPLGLCGLAWAALGRVRWRRG